MALPTINTPTYELEIPSTDEKIKYRPFLVKEEKILMVAMEGGEQNDIINAVKDIVQACTFDKIDISKMPMFDMEYIFLNIRAKSVGETSQLKLRCPDDNETFAEVEIDLTEVEVQVDDNHTNKIELTDDMGIIMKYPSINSFTDIGVSEINADNMLDVITSCIYQIYDKKGEEVFDAKDSTRKELNDFVEQCNAKQFLKIQSFFDTMPRLKHTVKVKNPKTEVESDITLTGLNDFFRIALSHSNLEHYFETTFALMQHHNYSLSDIETLMPWERDIYVQMLVEFIKEQNKKQEEKNRG